MGYDSLNRLILVTYSDTNTPTVRRCYDGLTGSATGCTGQAGNGQWMRQTWSGTIVGGERRNFTSYGFDLAGRLISSAQTTAGTAYPAFSYSYYNDDRLASITYPSGRTVVTCYDYNGRPVWASGNRSTADCTSGATLNTPAYATVNGYTPPGGISSLALGNAITETTSYNSRLQPAQMQAGSLLTIGYDYTSPQSVCASPPNRPTYPNNGNVQRQTITRGAATWTQSYCYEDGLNRLTQAAESGSGSWSQTYGYDRYGNRWLSTVAGLSPTLEAPQAATWYSTVNNHIVSSGWNYDASGNVIQIGGMTRSFGYDAENRQTTAAINGQTYTYEYDGAGRRVTKAANGSTTVYVYDGDGQLAAEYGGTAGVGTQYLTADALGSTRLVTDSAGAVVRSYDYLPFGEELRAGTAGRDSTFPPASPLAPDNATGIKAGFTGKERDGETGLDYFGARYMSSAQGRFTSPDLPLYDQNPFNPQSWNLYSYGRNNPLVNIDPSGRSCVKTQTVNPDGSKSDKFR